LISVQPLSSLLAGEQRGSFAAGSTSIEPRPRSSSALRLPGWAFFFTL